MKLFKLFIFLFVSTIFISCNSSDSSYFDAGDKEQEIIITGLVKDYSSQALMEDVTVEISLPASSELTTDVNGSFQTELTTDTDYILNFSKANFHPVKYILNTLKTTDQELDTVYLIATNTSSTSGASGVITSTSTDEPLANVTLSLRQGINNKVGNILAYTDSQADGTYNFNDVAIDTYTVQISLPKYEVDYGTLYVIGGDSGEGQDFTISPQVFELDGNNSVSGTITSATTTLALNDVTITLREGIGVKTGTIVGTSQSVTDGTYTLMNLPTGGYTAEMALDGYVTGYGDINVSIADNGAGNDFILSPTLNDNEEMRIILTWADKPADLDGILSVTADDGTKHDVTYQAADKNLTYGGITYAVLDVDDTNAYGPETITINYLSSGKYIYYINNYSATQLDISQAIVQVVSKNEETLVIEMETDTAGDPKFWEVLHIDDGVITVINQRRSDAPSL